LETAVFEELWNARQTELQLLGREIERRKEWEQHLRVPQRQRALRAATGVARFIRSFKPLEPRCRRRAGRRTARPGNLLPNHPEV
jgi:hypothetical protein